MMRRSYGIKRSSADDLLPSEGATVEVRGLVKRFTRGAAAVNGVSFALDGGAVLVVLGSSGCGKTTMLRMIAGLEVPDSGTVIVNGQNVTRMPAYRRKSAMVFQNYALFPHLTVAQNVGFGLMLRSVPKKVREARVAELLNLTGLALFGERYPHQLSGGEQQRVGLARALAVNPELLLMDEPFGALDRKLRKEIQQEFRDLQKRLRVTTIFVTHDQEEALLIGDLVAVMRSGAFEQLGTPTAVYDRPDTRFVASFLGEANIVEGRVSRRPGGTYELATDIGPIIFERGEALVAGQQATVMIRPELVRLEASSHHGIPGVVNRATYLGERARYEIAVASGRKIVASVPLASSRLLAEGARVVADWPVDAVHLLRA